MRAKSFVFYESEIIEYLKELNVKESDLEDFLDTFDNPSEWIHLFVEWLNDQDAERKG